MSETQFIYRKVAEKKQSNAEETTKIYLFHFR